MKYPQYYIVDTNIGVKLELKDDVVTGINHMGNPYPIGKAIIEGTECQEEDFNRLATARSASA